MENLRNHIDELVENSAFWTFVLSFHFAAAIQSPDCVDCCVYVRHVIADDDLVLPAALDDGDDAFAFFQVFRVRFAFVNQFETQTRNAMGQAADVFFAADMSQNVFC